VSQNYIITNNELYHYGVKGMKWGVRKARRIAKKDAKEYARAKMYYGEGAGNRRKLIKAKVNERSKDPNYKEAFEKALAEQDMANHATKAKAERARNTAVKSTVKTGRGIVNAAMGNIGRASATAAAIYTVGHVTGANKVVSKFAKEKASDFVKRVRK
jgi:hypothetical protein